MIIVVPVTLWTGLQGSDDRGKGNTLATEKQREKAMENDIEVCSVLTFLG